MASDNRPGSGLMPEVVPNRNRARTGPEKEIKHPDAVVERPEGVATRNREKDTTSLVL